MGDELETSEWFDTREEGEDGDEDDGDERVSISLVASFLLDKEFGESRGPKNCACVGLVGDGSGAPLKLL